MIIHAKLGTMLASYYQVLYKKSVKVGDYIQIREAGTGYYGCEWNEAKVDRVDTVDDKPFYFLSRW